MRHPSRFSFSSAPEALSLPIKTSKGVRVPPALLRLAPPSRICVADVDAGAVLGRTMDAAATKLARPPAPPPGDALTVVGVPPCCVASPRSLASSRSPSSPAGDGETPLA